MGVGTVSVYVSRARKAGLSWPLPADLDDGRLEARLFASPEPKRERIPPDLARIHQELKRTVVTLHLLWEEYFEVHPGGYRYSQAAERLQRGRSTDYASCDLVELTCAKVSGVDAPTGLDLLTAPWTGVSFLSQIVLAIQVGAIGVGLAPRIRKRVRRVAWFVGLVVGPPLLWTLCEASVGLILSLDVIGHFPLSNLYGWLLRLPMIIGTTVLLQCLLAWLYAAGPLRSLPVIGVTFGLLAILGDVMFVLFLITPVAR